MSRMVLDSGVHTPATRSCYRKSDGMAVWLASNLVWAIFFFLFSESVFLSHCDALNKTLWEAMVFSAKEYVLVQR